MNTLTICFVFIFSLVKLDETSSLYLGSFNIQNFGPTKLARPEFVSTVVKVLSRYDIVLIQEIKDIKEQVLPKLVGFLNDYVKNDEIVYGFTISPRLGTTSYKEQFAFIYQTQNNKNLRKINVINQYVYTDSLAIYERPPHVGNFTITDSNLSIKSFFLVNVHLKPTNVLNESSELRSVVDEILSENSNHNIAVMGDFNFDCDYISEKNRNIVKQKLFEFTWFISDKVETTVSADKCALDRIIITGDTFKKAVVANTNQTYYYNLEFGLSLNETLKISDHYPIEMQIN